MISYYELLGMIKEDKVPNKIRVHLTSKPRVYEAQYDESDFSHYFIYDGDADEDYHYYLAECFLESSMFDLNIEILKEEKKIPEKFKVHSLGDKDEYGNFVSSPFPTNEEFMDKINKIIDYLKSKGDE